MSSISGIFNLNGQAVSPQDLSKLNQAMMHHGTDSTNWWAHGACGLSQQMTCLTAESVTEKLPYVNDRQPLALVTACRLFNRQQLCNQLQITESLNLSDSDLLVYAYAKWGLDFVKYLLGEYSLALWNGHLQELVCVTDHFNTRPIYYYLNNNSFVFASEITALFTLDFVPRQPNLKKIALNDYMRIQLEPGMTSFHNIKFMPGGSLLRVNKFGIKLEQYWQPQLGAPLHFKSNYEFREAYQEIFSAAVKAVTRTHLPIGLQLSGGLDSSAIAVMAAKVLATQQRNLICFSNLLPNNYVGTACDESYFINLIQAPNLIKHRVVDEWRGPFDHFASFAEQLQFNPQHYQYRAINAAARSYGAKIVLQGTLGELSASYYGTEYLGALFRSGKWFKLSKEILAYKRNYSRSLAGILAKEVLKPNLPTAWQKYLFSKTNFNLTLQNSLINPEFIKQQVSSSEVDYLQQQVIERYVKSTIDSRNNSLNQLQWFNLNMEPGLGNIIEPNQAAVYASNPYFDKRLVEFCINLPNNYKFNNGYPRNILRQGMQDMLPPQICWRTCKQPYLPDYHHRYNKQLNQARELLVELAKNELVQQVINTNKLKDLLDYQSNSNRLHAKHDLINFLVIPKTLYLAKFLASFS